MKSVFVVEKGELHEGGSLWSIHLSREGAIKAALALKNHPSWGKDGWIKDEEEEDYWENGYEFLRVVKMKVQE